MHAVPRHEFSGVIEEIALDVRGLKKGDEVFGVNNWFRDGAAAEYCVTTPSEMAPKPTAIDHVHAAVDSNRGTNCLAKHYSITGNYRPARRSSSRAALEGSGPLLFNWRFGRPRSS